MKAIALIIALACPGLLAAPAAADARPPDATPGPTLAQADRCGPQPMKPSSCLTGTWICRCDADGRNCRWDLVGCDYPGRLPPRPGQPRPAPGQPDDPARPNLFGR